MVSTPFLIAQFTGQTANNDLSTYVPQSGDLNAVFTRTTDSASTTSLVFRSTSGLKSAATASGTVDIRYTDGQAATSTEGIDVAFDFSTGAAVLSGGQVGGFTFGDDGTTNRVNVFVNWTGTTPTLSMENVVNGTKTNLFASQAFPSGAAFALNTAYTYSIEVRGSAGAYTVTAFLALRGGTRAQISTANRAVPSLVLAGRKVGLRIATFGITNPGNETNGMFYDKLTASDYSATGGTSLTANGTTTVAGSPSTSVAVTAAAATGGTAPLSYQFQRAPDVSGAPGTFANVGSPVTGVAAGATASYTDTGLTSGSTYWYRHVVTDSSATPLTSTSASQSYTATASGVITANATTVVMGSQATSAIVTAAAANGGTAPLSYQFQRAPDVSGAAGTYANIGSPVTGVAAGATASYTDTGLTAGTVYWYRHIVTDSASTPLTAISAGKSYAAPSASVPSFSVITTPASMSLRQGESLTLAVNGTPSGGYSGNPALSVSGLPTGVTGSFSSGSLTGGGGSSTLTLTAAGNAITGAVEFTVRATDGTITQTVPVLLQVNPPSGIVYPIVSNILADDLITITRGGTTDQVAASVLKAYLAS